MDVCQTVTLVDTRHDTAEKVRKAYFANEDFLNATMGVRGTYASRSGVREYFPNASVKIRYRRNTRFVIIKPEHDK